jgi:hypothetical protein
VQAEYETVRTRKKCISTHNISGRLLSLRPTRNLVLVFKTPVDRDSSVGIATYYGLDGLGIEFRWGRDFPRPSRPALEPTQPPFPRVKRPGLDLDHPSTFSAEVEERVELYLHSHFGPSWHVLGWTLRLPFTQNTYRQHSQAVLRCSIKQRVLQKHNKTILASPTLNKLPDSSWTAWPWRWRLYALPKSRKIFTRRHGVIIQKIFTFINVAERTSYLRNCKLSLVIIESTRNCV